MLLDYSNVQKLFSGNSTAAFYFWAMKMVKLIQMIISTTASQSKLVSVQINQQSTSVWVTCGVNSLV